MLVACFADDDGFVTTVLWVIVDHVPRLRHKQLSDSFDCF